LKENEAVTEGKRSKQLNHDLQIIFNTFLLKHRKQRSYHEEISEKKQPQVQTIQRTVSSRNVIQDNDIMKKFWKGRRWFRRQCLRTFCYFLRTESRKWLFGKLRFYPSI